MTQIYQKEDAAMRYRSDLTDDQWEAIKTFFEGENRGKHLQKHEKREMVNAVLYYKEANCSWRKLPPDFPPHISVWNFYNRARINGLWDRIQNALEKAI
ncbi:MAG: transposase [Clostridiales bacterium]|nr:transposase [Clostridiales bacterium]